MILINITLFNIDAVEIVVKELLKINNNQISIFSIISKPKQVVDKKLPSNINLKKKESWCPYCSMPVIFIKDKARGIKVCPVCRISERDFWVKKVNNK